MGVIDGWGPVGLVKRGVVAKFGRPNFEDADHLGAALRLDVNRLFLAFPAFRPIEDEFAVHGCSIELHCVRLAAGIMERNADIDPAITLVVAELDHGGDDKVWLSVFHRVEYNL